VPEKREYPKITNTTSLRTPFYGVKPACAETLAGGQS